MAWYADLSPCGYFGEEVASGLRSIGWLQHDQPFVSGVVDKLIYDRLLEFLPDPWQPMMFLGVHQCDLCNYDGITGGNNLFIPTDEFIYVCPELICHYMNEHNYRPPDEFCRAVLECPPMR